MAIGIGLSWHNGAGKSTLLRVLAGVYAPTKGRIDVQGKVSPLFSASPGIDYDGTAMRISLPAACSRHEPRGDRRKDPDIEDFCELGEYLSLPMRIYSSGMMTRFAFALATTIDPGILLSTRHRSGGCSLAERANKRIEALVDRSHHSGSRFALGRDDQSMCTRPP